jgi:uncharacterized BrkB/YihY/UPF0761 family membrane protein
VARLRQKATAYAEQANAEVEQRRTHWWPLDVAITYYERDREALASALGAAVALRLYLFLIPVLATVVGVAIMVLGKDQVDSMLTSASVTATMAKDISAAADSSWTAGLALALVGLWLVLWAGRSLTRVLAACAGRAWRMEAKDSKASLSAMGALTAMMLIMFGCALLLNRLRGRHGIAADTTSWVFTVALFSAAWFVVTWFLPRRTPDPGALLPGAAFVGLTLTVVQWFMQFYLPSKLARTSEYAGQLGITVAALGYLFILGRLMASSFIVDAVIFERVGSLSRFVFALPVIRAIPRRYPIVGRFFDLHPDAPPTAAPETPPT